MMICVIFTASIFGCNVKLVFAQETTVGNDIKILNEEIGEKQSALEQLERQIKTYQEKIDKAQAKEASLANELDLLENRIAKTELDIEAVDVSIKLTNMELKTLEKEISVVQVRLENDKRLIANVLYEIQTQDNKLPLLTMFGTDSISELFDAIRQLENVSADLETAVEDTKTTKSILETQMNERVLKREQLVSFEANLKGEKQSLEDEMGAREVLIESTNKSEAEFRRLLANLKEEQEYIDYQVALIQKEIESKLAESDEAGAGGSALSWPINPSVKGISAYFHDPTYPFRHLFEHSGIDLPSPTGTQIGCAAPGYVAWTKKGQMYGNYVMVIHSGGIATLYAHLSKISVVADQFVSRGATIGAVGNTGFSTGPHLHFEVRKDGIPDDPLKYLIDF